MSTNMLFRRAATLLAVILGTLGFATDLAGARPIVRPTEAEQPAPQVGPVASDPGDPEDGGGESAVAGGLRPSQEVITETEVIADPDHAPGVPSPLQVLLDVEADGQDAVAHISVVQLQAVLGEDAQPVQVGLVWGDGNRALYDGGDLGREITAHHRYGIDASEVFTVHAWVTDDQGRSSTDQQNIAIEAEYRVSLSLATFQPWHHDCDGFFTGDGDFTFWYELSWGATNLSETEEFDLGDDELTSVFDDGIVVEGVSASHHPTLHVSWEERDFGLDAPPLGIDVPLHPRAGETEVETLYSGGRCRVRLQYLVTTVPQG